MSVVVEFFGMARARAGMAELPVNAATAREALDGVREKCPSLADVWSPGEGLTKHYLLSIDGTRFVNDLDAPLPPGARLLLLSADAGG